MMNLLDKQLGDYRLIRLLGQGGFSDVYLGEHLLLGTQTAIKVHHARMEGADLERFEQEARTIARLNHPHIIRVLDYGVQDGVAYLVMNYAPGGTLRQRHPPGTIVPLETVVQYVEQIASALQYAHDQGLIHRDVKPENMLIDADGQVLLSDFGIAIPARSTRSLGTQDAIGTVSYMAPEQLRKKARPASDQYALAIIVYEWLTGTPPFDGLPIEVALQHLQDLPQPLHTTVPTIPLAVELVVLKALAKAPEERFHGVQAFAQALEIAADEPPLTSSSASGRNTQKEVEELASRAILLTANHADRRPWESSESMAVRRPPRKGPPSRRVMLLVGLAFLVVLGASSSAFFISRSHVVSVRPTPATSPVPTTFPTVLAKETPTPSPTSTVAVTSTPTKPPPPTHLLSISAAITSVAWSPGGRLFAVADQNGDIGVWQVPHTLQWRANLGTKIWKLAWSPDNGQSQRLALACDDGTVRILDVFSGKQVLLYKGHGSASVLSVAWAPGTASVPYIVSGDINGQIHVWNPGDGTTRFTVSQAAPVTDLAASSYEFIAAGTQSGGTYSLWDARAGGAYQFTNDNQGGVSTPYDSLDLQLTPGTLTAVAWSEDGNYAAVGDAHGNIHFISDVSCSCFLHMSEYQAHQQQINAISWASTGLTFATASTDGTVQTWRVVLGNQSSAWTNVTTQHLLTFTANARVQTIAWSPDGQQILYGDSAGNVGLLQVQ